MSNKIKQEDDSLTWCSGLHKVAQTTAPLLFLYSFDAMRDYIGNLILAHLSMNALSATAILHAAELVTTRIPMYLIYSVVGIIGKRFGAIKKHLDMKNNLSILVSDDTDVSEVRRIAVSIGVAIRAAWMLSALMTILVCPIMYFMAQITEWFGQDAALAKIVGDFFRGFIFALPATMAYTCCEKFLKTVDKRTFIVLSNLLGLAVSSSLGYGLTLGKWGMPALGAKGLGYAFTLRAWFILFLDMMYIAFDPSFKIFKIFQFQESVQWQDFKEIFHIGTPIALYVSGEILLRYINTLLIGYYFGKVALAARNIASTYLAWSYIPTLAFQEANMILVAQSHGAKKYQHMRLYSYASMICSVSVAGLILLVMIFAGKDLAKIFIHHSNESDTKEIIHLSMLLFIINAAGHGIDCTRHMAAGAMRGLKDTAAPMILHLSILWGICFPASSITGIVCHLGLVGLVAAHNTGLLVSNTVLSLRWHKISRYAIQYNKIPPVRGFAQICKKISCFKETEEAKQQLLDEAPETGNVSLCCI